MTDFQSDQLTGWPAYIFTNLQYDLFIVKTIFSLTNLSDQLTVWSADSQTHFQSDKLSLWPAYSLTNLKYNPFSVWAASSLTNYQLDQLTVGLNFNLTSY